MNASFVPPKADTPDLESAIDWSAITTEVNRWRGQCLHQFARSEAAVSEALLLLSQDASRAIALPHLVGARYDELGRVLVARDTPSDKAALSALRGFRCHDKLRVFLCHGVVTALADQAGRWHVAFTLLAFRNGLAEREELFLTGFQAVARYKALRVAGQKLEQKLVTMANA